MSGLAMRGRSLFCLFVFFLSPPHTKSYIPPFISQKPIHHLVRPLLPMSHSTPATPSAATLSHLCRFARLSLEEMEREVGNLDQLVAACRLPSHAVDRPRPQA